MKKKVTKDYYILLSFRIELYGFSNTYSRESNLINKIIYKSRSEMNMFRLVLMIVGFDELFSLLFHF